MQEIKGKFLSNIDFNIKSFKVILALSIPVIIENILQVLLGTVDTFFVGKIQSSAIAGVGITNIVMNLYLAFFIAVGVGTTAVVARYIGRKEIDKAKIAAKLSFYFVSVISILIGIISYIFAKDILLLLGAKEDILVFAIPYFKTVAVPSIFMSLTLVMSSALRGSSDTKSSMYAVAVSNVINIVLDYFLIFGVGNFRGFGILGAGLATTISRAITVMILIYRIQRKGSILKIDSLRINKNEIEVLRSILKIGIPAGLEKLFMRSGQLIYNSLIISLGTSAYVAHNIAGVIESYSYLPAMGFGVAAATLVGQNLGANDYKKAKTYGFLSYILATMLMVLIGVVFFAFAPFLTGLFTSDIQIQSMASHVLRIIALFQPFLALTTVMSSALQGAGDTKSPMYSTLLGIWIIRVCIGYLLAVKLNLGLTGIWLAYSLDITIRGSYLLYRFIKGKWKNIKVC